MVASQAVVLAVHLVDVGILSVERPLGGVLNSVEHPCLVREGS
ncbi:hypothetical protein [Halocatena marina]|nr:hypothetical protein [Halocatena marina]